MRIKQAVIETTWALHGNPPLPRDWRRLARNHLRRRKNFLAVDRPKVFPYQGFIRGHSSANKRERGESPDERQKVNEAWIWNTAQEYARIWTVNNHLKV